MTDPGRPLHSVGVAVAAGALVLGATLAPASQATASVPGQRTSGGKACNVLVVGDSTTWAIKSRLAGLLRSRGMNPTINAKIGRTMPEGLAVLGKYRIANYRSVVVLLGANDVTNALGSAQALRAAGTTQMATVQAPAHKQVNSAITTVFGESRIRWAGYASARGIRTYDDKHYRRTGNEARAKFLAANIKCPA